VPYSRGRRNALLGAARTLAAAGTAGVLLALAACGSSSSGGSGAGASSDLTAAQAAAQIGHPTKALCAGHKYTIGYDSFSDTAPGTSTFLDTIKSVAAKLGCVTIVHTVNNVDPATALQNARLFVTRHVSAAIVFNAIAPNAAGQLKIFATAKIPVVQFGAVASGAPQLLAPEFDAGKLAGTNLAKAFAALNPGQVPYIIAGRNSASGQPYIGYMNNFISGAEAQFPGYPASKLVSLETTSDPVTAANVTRDALAKIPPTAPVIFMGNDLQVTEAMLQTISEQSGRHGDLYTVDGRGQDADKSAVCGASQFLGMVNYEFQTWADYTIPLAILQAQGDKVPAVTQTTVQWQSRSELCGS
jgi:ABC-type sugar transport system substrate-binding protein